MITLLIIPFLLLLLSGFCAWSIGVMAHRKLKKNRKSHASAIRTLIVVLSFLLISFCLIGVYTMSIIFSR